MPVFHYKAKTPDGRTVEGKQEAQSKLELAHLLKQKNLLLLSGGPEGGGGTQSFLKKIESFSIKEFIGGVSVAEKMMFSRNLSVMVGAGVPLTRAILTLARQTKSPGLKKALADVEARIRKGSPFSEALAQHQKVFGTLYVSMIAAGEATGNVQEALVLLSEQLKKQHELQSRVKGAMMYPMVIVAAMSIVGTFMLIFIVPTLADIFESFGTDLPVTTVFIINLGTFLANYWWSLFLIVPSTLFGLKKFFSSSIGHNALDWFLLNFPLFKGIVQKINSALFARTLSSLIAGGVPILDGLRITSDTIGNHYYKNSLTDAQERVRKGEPLNVALSGYAPALYTPLIIQMLEVGEETGELDDILKRLAVFYEEEVSEITKNLSSIIEPILMIIIGVAVGFFAVSMIQPMYGFISDA